MLADLYAHPGGPLASQLATPWRLNLGLTALARGATLPGLLPAMPSLADAAEHQYAQHVDGLLVGSYVASAVHLHDLAGRYNPKQVQRWLAALGRRPGLAGSIHYGSGYRHPA